MQLIKQPQGQTSSFQKMQAPAKGYKIPNAWGGNSETFLKIQKLVHHTPSQALAVVYTFPFCYMEVNGTNSHLSFVGSKGKM